tara:strand:- start:263 stop:475 length:213 start_codon:yes stop_codon:yes gene_type:complete
MKPNQTKMIEIVEVLKSGFIAQALQIASGNTKYFKAVKKIVNKRLTRRKGAKFEDDIRQACKIIKTWTIE